jgi:hypothetical protein
MTNRNRTRLGGVGDQIVGGFVYLRFAGALRRRTPGAPRNQCHVFLLFVQRAYVAGLLWSTQPYQVKPFFALLKL